MHLCVCIYVCVDDKVFIYTSLDIDECTTGTHNCKSTERCINKPGRFTCKCANGYRSVNKTCEGTADKIHQLVSHIDLRFVYRCK